MLDIPFAVAAIVFSIGSFVGVIAFFGACEIHERWSRRGR